MFHKSEKDNEKASIDAGNGSLDSPQESSQEEMTSTRLTTVVIALGLSIFLVILLP